MDRKLGISVDPWLGQRGRRAVLFGSRCPYRDPGPARATIERVTASGEIRDRALGVTAAPFGPALTTRRQRSVRAQWRHARHGVAGAGGNVDGTCFYGDFAAWAACERPG